jgi:sensor histidine kinase YesM
MEEIGDGSASPRQGVRRLSVNERTVLVAMSEHRGVWYGSWIELSDFARQIPLEEGRILAFTDRDGQVLYASRELPEQVEPRAGRQKIGGQSYLISAAASPSGELYALELVPARQISGALPFAIRLLQLLSVAAVIALPILLLAMQHWVLGPVAQLNRAIETVEGGDLDYRIPEKEQGTEFNRINRSFNHMMDQVEELKISVYEEQLKAQKIKLGFLAQQIKPHFILNTLNILYSYEQEEFPLIQRMIVYLSRYFRYVINANQDFVTLGQEMEHLRNYFEIQQARYVRTFEATVDYDPDLANCLIPPLLLQSFAENAIKYALLPDRIVQIRVTAEKTETGMRLTVTDDGRGISPEMLARIEQFRRDRVFRRDLGVGVQNAIDRVDLLYSGRGSVELAAREGGGTLVTIDLPALHRRETERKTEAEA